MSEICSYAVNEDNILVAVGGSWCDGPRMRRFLRITFAPAPFGGVAIETELVREEPRAVVHLLDRHADRGNGLLESCSWCERVKVLEEWMEIEEAVTRLQLFEDATLPVLTHGICEVCAARIQGELALP